MRAKPKNLSLMDLSPGVFAAMMVAGLAAAALALTAGLASPAVAADSSCVKGCTDALRSCSKDVHDAAAECRSAAGCDDLAAELDTACAADGDEDVCAEAKQALRDCVEPCRDEAQTQMEACRTTAETCLSEQCGVSEIPPPPCRPGRGHGRKPA